jgi:putative sigma-54 modulation protein
MQIEINSRQFNLGDEQKEKITNDLEKLARFSPRPPLSARLNLVNEKGRFTADLVFFLKSSDFRSKVEGVEPEIAVDGAIENIRTQLQRFKGKMASRKKGEEGGLGRAMVNEATGSITATGDAVLTEGFQLRDLTVEDALDVYSRSQRPFLVFRNAENFKLSIVYARKDGQFGLMEAQDD